MIFKSYFNLNLIRQDTEILLMMIESKVFLVIIYRIQHTLT
jgi:hypothetical protein